MSVVEAAASNLLEGLDASAAVASAETRSQGIGGAVSLTLAGAQLIWLAAVAYLAYRLI